MFPPLAAVAMGIDMSDYDDFLKTKEMRIEASGFDLSPDHFNPMLFDWQRDIVRWALRRRIGRRGRKIWRTDNGNHRVCQAVKFVV